MFTAYLFVAHLTSYYAQYNPTFMGAVFKFGLQPF